MMKLKVVFFIFYLIANTTTLEDCISDLNCSSTLDYNCSENETVICFSRYDLLEEYIRNNESILTNLAETFYRTGRSPAKFVKITYKFQIPGLNDSHNNKTYNSSIKCSSIERTYYWSTSPIYLLGPKPLMYLSMFGIIVQEENVIVQLPCLKSNDQKVLLSRLTYLV